jgi:hypothetical protein
VADQLLQLPALAQQVDRLVELGLPGLAHVTESQVRAAVSDRSDRGDALLVISPQRLAPSVVAPLLERQGKPGFVVEDMTDVDAFAAIDDAAEPGSALYLLHGPDRGVDLAGWSPDEALPEIRDRGRTPLTLSEGIHWLLQQPEALARNACFMTAGSRLRKPGGALDARTPALWISNGTGRDGASRRDAPKVGWCWAGNRHTWLGIASAAGRSPLPG